MSESSTATELHRFALSIEYDGSCYHGWQAQRKPSTATVQEELEAALSKVAATGILTHCAGRTDARVHGTNQIVHFVTSVVRPPKAWVFGTNSNLPDSISVRWAKEVPADFHARFSAQSRRYRYVIFNSTVRPALYRSNMTWYSRKLDHELMQAEAQCLLGEQDFSSFRALACQSLSPIRNVHHIEVSRQGDLVIIDVKANSFVHHMVRNIAGVLMTVGSGQEKPGWTKEVLDTKDRTKGGVTASPCGLYLVAVEYPEHYGLPQGTMGPHFLSD